MSQRGRKCECCGPVCGGIDRRDFIKTAAAGAVGLAVGSGSLSEAAAEAKPYWIENQLPPEKLAEWRKHVLDLTPPRIYSSRRNPDARFPLGGIGTGNFYIGTDGRMTGWSVTNGGGELDIGEPFFAIRAAAGKAAPVVRVLSTRPPESTRGVADIEMTGEYPIAELRYRDTDLPIQVSLTTHTPFVPLDSKRSAYPAAIFQFHLKNRTRKRMRVSLMAAMPNCVGLAGWGRRTESSGSASGLRHPNYGGNFNEFGKAGELRMIRFRAAEGQAASCDSAVRFFVHASESDFDRTWRRASRHERPDNVTIVRANPSGAIVKQIESASESARVIWLENPTAVPLDFAKALGLAAKAGATVVFSGDDAAVLRRLTSSTLAVEKKGLPDIVFDDFESGSYANWTVEGEAFGKAPQSGTLPRQQPVSGFLGKRLVNSFVGGDGTTGKMTSKPFTIERPLISFLIGGGSDPDRTCMRLVVDNKPVRVATGRNNERLDWQVWDVREFVGKRGQLEIVDSARGPWGHINVDHIVFTENAPEDKLAAVLRDVLPVTFSDVVVHEEPTPALTLPRGEKRRGAQFRFDAWAEYKDLQLLSGGEIVLRSPAGQPMIMRRKIGKGQVCLVAGRILSAQWSSANRSKAMSLLAALAGVRMEPSKGLSADAPSFGELVLATDSPGGGVLAWDSPRELVAELASPQRIADPQQGARSNPTSDGVSQGGALTAEVELAPRAETKVAFLLAWHFPNDVVARNGQRIGHQYSNFWPNATAVASDLHCNLEQLDELTQRFRETLYDSTLPYWLLDCITSQASTIRIAGVCFWMENGIFAGWEGNYQCCQPTCTHVWGYEQTLAHLFPDLERSMRYVDYARQQLPNGGINNRVEIPIPDHPSGERPFTDGHSSCVLKAYREALRSPDQKFFKQYWPNIKKAVEYLISRDGERPDGIIEDEQWHTYDVAAYGPNSFLGSYYLAALRAGEEMALRAGEKDTAQRWREIFETGSRRLVELCWNGEYFQQNFPEYRNKPRQWGPGCLADQLIGQWWAHQLGLGYLLPQEYVRAALEAVFKYCWLSDLTNWRHIQRWFADGDDKGLLCCTWPKGGRPQQPILYCDEVWTGVEYQVAAHMIYEGMLEEAFAIVKGARERYDGRARTKYDRNPWDEKECGGHYARAMSSWSLLLALSGFLYDGPRGQMTFAPAVTPERFRSFFSAAEGWGTLSQTRRGKRQESAIKVVYGKLMLRELTLRVPEGVSAPKATAHLANKAVEARVVVARGQAQLAFRQPVTVAEGQTLSVRLSWA